MKQAFVVVVDHKEPLNEIQLSMIIQSGLFDHYYENGDKISVVKTIKQNVEQTCGTPENTSENSKKPLRLSGNIVWENQIDFGDDYLDDRMNSLIDR